MRYEKIDIPKSYDPDFGSVFLIETQEHENTQEKQFMALNYGVPTQETMLEFAEVYLQAVELSWRDDVFKAALLEDPMSALRHYFHYNTPWNFRLIIEQVEGGEYGWINNSIWNLPVNEISVGLPTAPKNLTEHPVALALYNNAGPSYLFSCC